MKDSYDKDPFAEYDKYWDDLDKKEEQVNRNALNDYYFSDNRQIPQHRKTAIPFLVALFSMIVTLVVISIVVIGKSGDHGIAGVFIGPLLTFSMLLSPIVIFVLMAIIFAYIIRRSNRK